jgi:hypothetical protein
MTIETCEVCGGQLNPGEFHVCKGEARKDIQPTKGEGEVVHCPRCGAGHPWMAVGGTKDAVVCDECGYRGPMKEYWK